MLSTARRMGQPVQSGLGRESQFGIKKGAGERKFQLRPESTDGKAEASGVPSRQIVTGEIVCSSQKVPPEFREI